ncbi:hypothetical protein SAMN05216359_10314 [Roseateles sp. YR242]|uniref:hypothetical protein n=1 Tax=Roseateles sp. YR242 TaxID=1855305 RepID=UPI0008CA19E3|nr:hypothetical protein [Roseateles sp. YR242]SEK76895.1 hypothetical protein SAMN05216359_10314 [Roseateles sp. YR242]
MKTIFKTLLVLGLVMVLASMALGVLAIGFLSDAPGVHISINGEDWSSTGFSMGDAFGAFLGISIAAVVLCVVVPLVLLLGLGLPLLILGGLLALGIAAVLGVGAVLGSPLLLVVLIVWLLVRDKSRGRTMHRTPPAPPAPSV